MNKLLYIVCLLCGLLCGNVVLSQNSILDSIEYRSPYLDLRPVRCTKNIHYDGDKKIHGVFTIKGADELKWSRRTDSQQYTEIRHYQHGVLEGSFSQTYSHSGVGSIAGAYQVDRRWSIKGQFANGRPDGAWVFTVTSKMVSGGEREHTKYTETAVYENGELRSIADGDGHRLIVHPDGTLSGNAKMKDGTEVTLSHSIVMNSYLDIDGERLKVGPRQQSLLATMVSPFIMADSGYAIDYQEIFLIQTSRLADHVDRYGHLNSVTPMFAKVPYSVRIGQLRKINPATADDAFEYYYQMSEKADQMLGEGYFVRRNSKRFFGSAAEKRIRAYHTKRQNEALERKLETLVRLSDEHSWDEITADCEGGKSPLLDLIAVQWSENQMTSEEMYKEAARVINEKLRSLYPVSGYHILSSTYTANEGLKAQVEMRQLKDDGVSYESKKVEIQTSPAGHIMISRMNPSQYLPMSNDWDSVWMMEKALNQRHKELLAKMRPLKLWIKEYEHYYDSAFADRTTRPEVRRADLEELQEIQNDIIDNLELFATIQHQHDVLKRESEQSRMKGDRYAVLCRREFPDIFWSADDLNQFIEEQKNLISTSRGKKSANSSK